MPHSSTGRNNRQHSFNSQKKDHITIKTTRFFGESHYIVKMTSVLTKMLIKHSSQNAVTIGINIELHTKIIKQINEDKNENLKKSRTFLGKIGIFSNGSGPVAF